MQTPETTNSGAADPKTTDSETISRRTFVERLRRAAVFVLPVAATVALTAPKAAASYP
jgi:hypothetical protein